MRAQLAAGDVGGSKAEEAYALAFTCGVCEGRSVKKISKRAYHHGVVLVRCGGCNNLHLIADNLKWFGDETINIEQIMREKGEEVQKLNQFRLGGDDLDGPMVQVEGFDLPVSGEAAGMGGSGSQGSCMGLAPVLVPNLPDIETVAAAAVAAADAAAAARAERGNKS